MIGVNDVSGEKFTLSDPTSVAAFAVCHCSPGFITGRTIGTWTARRRRLGDVQLDGRRLRRATAYLKRFLGKLSVKNLRSSNRIPFRSRRCARNPSTHRNPSPTLAVRSNQLQGGGVGAVRLRPKARGVAHGESGLDVVRFTAPERAHDAGVNRRVERRLGVAASRGTGRAGCNREAEVQHSVGAIAPRSARRRSTRSPTSPTTSLARCPRSSARRRRSRPRRRATSSRRERRPLPASTSPSRSEKRGSL